MALVDRPRSPARLLVLLVRDRPCCAPRAPGTPCARYLARVGIRAAPSSDKMGSLHARPLRNLALTGAGFLRAVQGGRHRNQHEYILEAGVWCAREEQLPLPDRHFRASTRMQRRPAVKRPNPIS